MYCFTLFVMLAALIGALKVGLLPAMLAGLLVYQIVEFGARLLVPAGVVATTGKIILLLLIALLVISGFVLGVIVMASYVSDGPESFVILLQKMADVVDAARSHLPLWVQGYLPANFEEWQVTASEWLRENASHFSDVGQEAGISLVHLIFGMIIGGMIALRPGFQKVRGPLAAEMKDRVGFLVKAFRRIVFSQIRISALNTFLTAIFLAGILPLSGNPLPLTKTMIAVTFFVGLLPIVGNLMSNTVIFLISLSVSPFVAISALVYLIIIHKLEYFMNAHIIGTQIRAKAWELLLAMLVMESAFGISGLVAAPIYYAYLKDELTAKKLV
ncbi:MAG: AI-2E family transporter [Alphaproteobacteria bacterium]|nr:AI-2E family transporter [Alphaproteobacteria bacterium]